MNTPKVIYLIQDFVDGEECLVWCDSPAPTHTHNPDDAIKYIHTDEVDARLMQAAQFHVIEVKELQDRFKRLVNLSEGLLASLNGDVADVDKKREALTSFLGRHCS